MNKCYLQQYWFGCLVCLFVLSGHIAEAAEPVEDRWSRMEKEVVRLNPSSFPNIPDAVRKDLQSRKCMIPQAGGYSKAHNIVKGCFIKPEQLDWAVLCSVAGVSRILIYKGDATEAIELPESESPDKSWLQGGVGYSRALGVADAKAIQYYKEAFGGAVPPIDHEGIDEYFVEKASTIHYWYNNAWLELQGAD